MLYRHLAKPSTLRNEANKSFVINAAAFRLGATPRSGLQLSATRSGTDEAGRKSRRHLLSLQERFEDERVTLGTGYRPPAPGACTSTSYETDFVARNCDVDSHNTWYKESVRSQRHKLAATAIGYFRMVAR
jgi:hypothetical protein